MALVQSSYLKEDQDESNWWTNPNLDEDGEDLSKQTHYQWHPPNEGWLKFNTDASVNEDDRTAGIGGVLRDWNGKMLAIFANPWKFEDVNKVELEAIRVALSKAVKLKHQLGAHLVIESDSRVAVSWCLSPTSRPTLYGKTFEEIDKYVKELSEVVIQSVDREENALADSFAKLGRRGSMDRFFSWVRNGQ